MNQEVHTGKVKTGLFFGSFNPVHTGHLIIANHMLEHTSLDEVWFVVSPQNPLKNQQDLFDEKTRCALVQLAIEGNAGFKLCDRELTLQRPSYSCKTIEVLMDEYPGHDFVLIIGSDNLDVFDQWKNHEKILEMLLLFVYPRGGTCHSPFLKHPSVQMIHAPLLDISSTMIRENMRLGKDVRYLVPDTVYGKIKEGVLKGR
jgi:nicotinate-nucleotide adenylyltransferase